MKRLLFLFLIYSQAASAGYFLSDFCDKALKSCTDTQFFNALKASKGDVLWVDFDEVSIDFKSPLWPTSQYDKSKAGWYSVTLDGKASIRNPGSGSKNAVIKTNALEFYNMSSFTFKNLTFTAKTPTQFYNPNNMEALIQFGGNNLTYPVRNIHLQDMTVTDAPGDLIYAYNINNFKVINSNLTNAGRSGSTTSNGDRPMGIGIESHLMQNMLIDGTTFSDLPRVGITLWYASANGLKNRDINSNITISNNTIKNIGLTGIYIGQTLQNKNVLITNNKLANIGSHMIRINGIGAKVVNNTLVSNESNIFNCGNGSGTQSGAVGIIGYMLQDSIIENNCIDGIATGIHLKSWGRMKNNKVQSNYVNNIAQGIELLVSGSPSNPEEVKWKTDRFYSFDGNGYKTAQAWHISPDSNVPVDDLKLSNLNTRDNNLTDNTISDNTIKNYSTQAICLVCRNTYPIGHVDMSKNNIVYRNTITNYGTNNSRASVEVEYQDNLNVSYNWIRSVSNQVSLELKNVTKSTIERSTLSNTQDISTPAINRLNSSGNTFKNLDICGFSTHGLSLGDGNTISNIKVFNRANCPT